MVCVIEPFWSIGQSMKTVRMWTMICLVCVICLRRFSMLMAMFSMKWMSVIIDKKEDNYAI